jgi:hypothetical protein
MQSSGFIYEEAHTGSNEGNVKRIVVDALIHGEKLVA